MVQNLNQYCLLIFKWCHDFILNTILNNGMIFFFIIIKRRHYALTSASSGVQEKPKDIQLIIDEINHNGDYKYWALKSINKVLNSMSKVYENVSFTNVLLSCPT
jgi:hypothetical protein